MSRWRYHTVTKPRNVDLGTFPPGHKTSYSFEQPGTVRVHCKIHPEMTATIVVR
jgi:plastocyanin